MSQYVEIGGIVNHKYNYALYEIISFIGEKEKKKHRNYIQSKKDFWVGLDYIARKCGFQCKKAIRYLVYAKPKKTYMGTRYCNWKFHKRKAKKLFSTLNRILKQMNAPEQIWDIFNLVYQAITKHDDVGNNGKEIISWPYLEQLTMTLCDEKYSTSEKKAIKAIVDSFPTFNRFYHPSEQERKNGQVFH